jgi:serine/threonine-protein kinase
MPVLEGVRRTTPTATAQISMSATGLVVYAPGPTVSSAQQDLALFDRQGQTQPLKLPPASYDFPRLSPDGRRVAYSVDDGRDASIWIYELSGAASPRRLTIGGRSRIPVWSGDGQRVIFQSDRDGIPSLYWQPADGSGAAERLTTAEPRTLHVPESASRDGRYLLFARSSENSITSWVYSFADRKATQFPDVQSASVPSAAFSPDGRWVAYSSTDNAVSALRIYVQPFPPTGAKYEIGGGIHPLWSSDGTELFFTAVIAGNLAAVRISTRPSFSIGKPALFVRGTRDGGPQFERPFDIGPDGRFIGVLDVVESGAAADAALVRAQELRVVTNWFDELKQRVPIK